MAQDILSALDCHDVQLSVLITDDMEIAALNKQYLGRTGPTNVIAFPMREGEFSDIAPELLGDVVISIETTDKEAQESGMELETRFSELLIHGILHLLGYDHENDEQQAREMEDKSRELLFMIRNE
ncbi:MAG: rRNA maturation RNase YbeY [Desulfobacterales bacterium]|nr:rRNA maturation RNase YbeY [Desulfobacterales bacterium]